MVTDVVQQRKSTRIRVANFPELGARASAANKTVSQEKVRFRAFFGVQNRAELRRIAQKVDKNVPRTTRKDGFSRPVLSKRAKSRRSCQALKILGYQSSVFSSHRPADLQLEN